MYLLKRIRPLLAVLGMVAFSAICASAQAEIDPDHFPDPPVQKASVQKAHVQRSNAAAHSQHASQKIKTRSEAHAAFPASRAHSMSATNSAGVSKHSVNHAAVQKQYKKRGPEVRRHGAS